MICKFCGGSVLWMGKLSALSHTECQECKAVNAQEPEPVDEDRLLEQVIAERARFTIESPGVMEKMAGHFQIPARILLGQANDPRNLIEIEGHVGVIECTVTFNHDGIETFSRMLKEERGEIVCHSCGAVVRWVGPWPEGAFTCFGCKTKRGRS